MKKSVTAVLATVIASAAVAQVAPPAGFDFETARPGPVTDCAPSLTGGGGPVLWLVVEDPTAPNGPHVIAEMSGDRTSNRFPLCIFPEPQAANVEVSVAFKAVSGLIDQAAGLMVRVRDENNYYIARANALEDNVRFYKVENGQRIQLGGADAVVDNGRWQTLGLRIQGREAEILLDGAVLFTVADATFADAGRVGVWTKADSVTYFDHFIAAPLP